MSENTKMIKAELQRAVERIDKKLGKQLGEKTGLEVAEELYIWWASYVAASEGIDLEAGPASKLQAAKFVARITDALRSTLRDLSGEKLEVVIAVLLDGTPWFIAESHQGEPPAAVPPPEVN